jgi:predicted RNA binding protein YcfA (HicA-like mRNA interferase family)
VANYDRELRRVLSQNGCFLTRHGKGSHEIWHSPITNRNISVNIKIKSRHSANEILKEAGIKQKF